MKAKEGFRLRKLGSEYILTAEGATQINFNRMISLNATAAYLWEAVEGKEFTVETLRDLLLEKYDVAPEVAEKDAAALAAKWEEAELIEK